MSRNSDRLSTTLMESIVDYQKDEALAIPKYNKYIVTKRGKQQLMESTKGWKLLVLCKEGSETWVPLKYLTVSHPM